MAVQSLKKEELEMFPSIAIEFQQSLISVYGRSPNTIFEYLLDLRLFFKFLVAQDLGINPSFEDISDLEFKNITIERLAAVSKKDIISFLFYLTQVKQNSASSRARKLSSIKTFYKFLVTSEYIKVNPTETISGPKKRQSLPKYLTLEESLLLLETVNQSQNPNKKRDYAILTLFLNCGMRLSELVNINLVDISQDFSSLRVIGKGNKERMVYLNDACSNALKSYLVSRLDGTPEKMKQKALFLSSRNERISNKTIQWLVYKYLDAANLHKPGMSVHKLRHTAATLMYQTGKVDVRVLKEILGHEQLNTTQIYTHVSNKNMSDAVNNNPLAEVQPTNPLQDIMERTKK